MGILFSQREGLQPASVLRIECRERDRTLVDGWYSVLLRRWGLARKKELPPLRYFIGRKGGSYSEPMEVARGRLIPGWLTLRSMSPMARVQDTPLVLTSPSSAELFHSQACTHTALAQVTASFTFVKLLRPGTSLGGHPVIKTVSTAGGVNSIPGWGTNPACREAPPPQKKSIKGSLSSVTVSSVRKACACDWLPRAWQQVQHRGVLSNALR